MLDGWAYGAIYASSAERTATLEGRVRRWRMPIAAQARTCSLLR
jgi:hypothetical protein